MSDLTSVAALLRAALAKIERPEDWCQGVYAQDRHGLQVPKDDLGAARWCVEGACLVVGHEYDFETSSRAICFVHSICNPTGAISTWNDAPDRTHAEVLRMMQRAIAVAEGDAP